MRNQSLVLCARLARGFIPCALALLPAAPLRALVINEIMYHSTELDDRPFEFIELYNENADPLDLTGFRICNGVDYEFPAGTWIEGKSFLVVCAVEASIQSKHGISNTVGDWFTDPNSSRSLGNGGERIEICNPGGRTVIAVRYNDRGSWHSGADGTGHSLALKNPYLEVDDPDNWALSLEVGGTPGEPNGITADEGSGPPPSSGLDGAGFILRWLVLGPYTGSSCALGARLTRDWLRESAGGAVETELFWENGQVVDTNFALAESDALHPNAGTAKPTVKAYSGASDTINLNDVVYPPDPNQVMAYAFVYVDNVTAGPLAVNVACASDDAITVMLNGAYVHVNDACRGGGAPGEVQDRAAATLAVGKNLVAVKVFENGGGWNFRLRFEERTTGNPLVSKSVIQITTDHTKGLDFGGGGAPIEPPDPSPDPGPDPGPGVGVAEFPVVINEALLRTAGERWVELHNRDAAQVDLSGYHLTDDPRELTKATLAPGVSIAGGGYLAFSDVDLGLEFTVAPPGQIGDRKFIALVAPGGQRVLDAYNFEPEFLEYSEARIPNDDRKFTAAADPTRAASNATSASTAVVINEVMYHPIDNDNRKEYIELFNKGSTAVDLTGWRISDGVNFDFAAGTVIPAGGHLVIARDPSLFTGPGSIYNLPAGQVVGPATEEALLGFGALRNSGERITLSDHLNRTVDTVRYQDGGEWPQWADGGGSSLELIDANQDHRQGMAWDASDDSAKAAVRTYSYTAQHKGGESELAVLLLDRGITVVDDVSIVGGGVTNQDTVLIDADEVWRYLKGTSEPPANWMEPGFSDGSWASGPTGIGYGDNDDATVLTDMLNSYMTIYCRKSFPVANRGAVDKLILSLIVDDGFYAYLNGELVASDNVTSPAFDAAAPSALEPRLVEVDLSAYKAQLINGTNLLAVQVHNAGLASTDLSFIPRLIDRTTTVGGGSEQLTNGHFNADTSGWMIEGTHIRSGRTTQGPISGVGSLKIIAAGRGDNRVNRLETPDAAGNGLGILNLNEDLLISFKARWVVGSQSLLTHGYEHEMARSHALDVPLNLGTPGARNQVTQRLIGQSSSSNLGPMISDVEQDPAVPGANQPVKVTARVFDPDGVASVSLRWSLNNPSASPSSVVMTRIAGTDRYQGTIPGQALLTRVVFFITAADAGARGSRYPVDITQRTHPLLVNPPAAGLNDHRYLIYRHDVKNPSTSFASYRFWMTQAKEDELTSRRLHSNDLVPGSFVFGGNRIYHEAHTRFSGSPFARGGWGGSFRVRMPAGDPLHGSIRRFGLEDHHGNGGDCRERLSHYLIRQNQGGVPVPYSDVFKLARWQVNDRVVATREHYWVPDGDFVSLWFPGDDEGDFLEMDDRFIFNDSGGRAGNTDARVLYPPSSSRSDGNGANKENYRWFFNLRSKEGADEYANFIAFARVMDPGDTNDQNFDRDLGSHMNVEEMLRIWAVQLNIDDWDSWGASRGKNCYFYRPEADGRFNLLAWDLELTYGNVNANLIPDSPATAYNPGGFTEVNRLFNRPKFRRMYYSILNEMVNGPGRWFHSSYLSPYMDRLAALGMTNTQLGQPGGFIDQRAALVQPRIRSVIYPQARLTITTNGGSSFSTPQPAVNLAGTAPVDVSDFQVTVNDGEGVLLAPAYSGMTTWTVNGFALVPGANAIEVFGLDLRGNIIDSDSIVVTYTGGWAAPRITGLNPGEALPGADIEIFGTDFHNGLKVFFGVTQSPVVVFDENGATPGKIVARVPAGSGTVNVSVRNSDNQLSNSMAFTFSPPPPTFLRGDANGDELIDLADALRVLLHLFGGSATDCQDALDVDDDEVLSVTDAVDLLGFLFRGGAAPRAPFPAAGTDPSGSALGCQR